MSLKQIEELKVKARVKGFVVAQAWSLSDGPNGRFTINKDGLISVVLRNLEEVEAALCLNQEVQS